jgi:integrase/recombinase XerD
MVVVHGVRVTGPLAPYAEGLAGELARLGFKPSSARLQMQVAAHLSRWLAQAGLGAAALDGPVTDRYLAARRAAGYTAYLTLRALGPLLGCLRRLGVAPEPVWPGPATAAEALQEEYRAWLLGERGVTPAVARGYLDLVRPFVERHAADGGAGLGALAAGDVTAFLTAQSRRLAPKTAQLLATALRSLLRFWHLQGLTSGPLDRAVPRVANRRPGLPRPLEPAQVLGCRPGLVVAISGCWRSGTRRLRSLPGHGAAAA